MSKSKTEEYIKAITDMGLRRAERRLVMGNMVSERESVFERMGVLGVEDGKYNSACTKWQKMGGEIAEVQHEIDVLDVNLEEARLRLTMGAM